MRSQITCCSQPCSLSKLLNPRFLSSPQYQYYARHGNKNAQDLPSKVSRHNMHGFLRLSPIIAVFQAEANLLPNAAIILPRTTAIIPYNECVSCVRISHCIITPCLMLVNPISDISKIAPPRARIPRVGSVANLLDALPIFSSLAIPYHYGVGGSDACVSRASA